MPIAANSPQSLTETWAAQSLARLRRRAVLVLLGTLALGAIVQSPAPSFIYLAALPEKVGETIASLRAAGVQAPIIGGDGLDTPNVLASESGPTTNVWFTTHAWLSAETGSPAAKEFVQAYEKAYGEPPQDAFAALGYDSANLLLDAIKRAEGASPDQIQAALAATRNFQGVTGEISYGDGSHLPQKTVWILHVEAGRKSLATSLIPASTPPPILADQQ